MKKARIFVTDDDEGVQDIIKIIFEKAGFIVTIFPDGETLLNNLRNPPDIFLLDKHLSGMDGLDICRFLKSNPATENIPVIMISATPGIRQAVKEAGADDFIEKPFKIKDLFSTVEKHLTKIKAHS